MSPTSVRRSNEDAKTFTLFEIAALVGGQVCGDSGVMITGIAGIQEAEQGDITFLHDKRYLSFLHQTKASAIMTTRQVVFKQKPLLYVDNPALAFTTLFSHFRPSALPITEAGIHASAVVGREVVCGQKTAIGAHAVIQEGAQIGDRSVIGANCYIGSKCRIGQDVLIYPNVVIREDCVIGDRVIIHSGTVIGSDGFGYETVNGEHLKIPQIGNVVIESDVEIGANVCVDRGRFSSTRIQKGVKIDNLVQVAHNVVIGPHSLVVSQAGISGSTEIGRSCVIAGQAGLVGHIQIGDGAIIGAGAGVTKSVPAKAIMLGGPAKPIREQKRLFALISRLPELFKDVSELKKKSGRQSSDS